MRDSILGYHRPLFSPRQVGNWRQKCLPFFFLWNKRSGLSFFFSGCVIVPPIVREKLNSSGCATSPPSPFFSQSSIRRRFALALLIPPPCPGSLRAEPPPPPNHSMSRANPFFFSNFLDREKRVLSSSFFLYSFPPLSRSRHWITECGSRPPFFPFFFFSRCIKNRRDLTRLFSLFPSFLSPLSA